MFKRILSVSFIFLLVFGFMQFKTEAASSSTVLIKDDGVIVDINAKSIPGAKVALLFLKPESGEVSASNIGYIGQITADENGEISETFYIPEGTGNHMLKMSNCHDISYDVSRVNPQFFATSWSGEYQSDYIFPFYRIKLDDCCDTVTENDVSKRVINTDKIKASAEKAKAYFENFPAGRRYMIVWQKLISIINDKSENYLWWDVSELKGYMESFFAAFKEIGGEVDGVVCDFEPTPMDASNLRTKSINILNAGGGQYEPFKAIESDPRYATEIRPQLVEREFEFSDNAETELYNLYKSPWSVNSLKWNSVITNKRVAYLNEAVFDVVKKYYPDAKSSAYGHAAGERSHMISTNGHDGYRAGKGSYAGTHSSSSLYGTLNANSKKQYLQFANLDADGNYLRDAYTLLKYDVNRARGITLSEDNGFMPWVANYDYRDIEKQNDDGSYTYKIKSYFGRTPYYYEMIFHVGLLNPDVFLYWGPKYNNESDEYVIGQAEKLNACLEELDVMAGYPDREILTESLDSWNTDFILTGMKANGRNIWRITPNLEIKDENDAAVYTIESFCKSKDTPTFEISGTEITFPQGKIIENDWSIAEYGYWVETPANVRPEISYDHEYYSQIGNDFVTSFHVFDNTKGLMNSEEFSEDITVRFSYQNLSGEIKNAVVFAAGYTDDGKRLAFVHNIFEGSIAFGEDGYEIYRIADIDEKIQHIKLFLWNDRDGLVPLGTSVEMEKAN
ncbi:MAG: hypothetical protein II997_09125 [Clostridia bacterium]|nr:hypothetical protein [Clostridia bacterium]